MDLGTNMWMSVWIYVECEEERFSDEAVGGDQGEAQSTSRGKSCGGFISLALGAWHKNSLIHICGVNRGPLLETRMTRIFAPSRHS